MKLKPPSPKPKAVTPRVARKAHTETPMLIAQNRVKPVGKTSTKARGRSVHITATAPRSLKDQVGHSKQARLIAVLNTRTGASIAQMMSLTGWQAHTVRGTISGVLRKKLGLTVNCEATDDSGDRRYRIITSTPKSAVVA